MVKELRELVAFILSFGTDLVEVMRNSALSSSPAGNVGVERSKALNLTAVVAIILLSIYIKTLDAIQFKVDVILFSIICIGYFMLSAMLLSFYLRRVAAKSYVDGNASSSDIDTDAHTFVLSFNIVALLSFVIVVEVAVILLDLGDSISIVNWLAALLACATATAVFWFVGRRVVNKPELMSKPQRVCLLGLLSFLFFMYTRIILV